MEDRTNVIHIESLSRSFRIGESEVQALKNVNLTVNEGEFLGILGPSGSGKSTLMNVIGCMDTVQKGEYHLMGLPIQNMNDAQLTLIRNRLIGFIFQKYFLVPKYSVLQNVMMPLLVRGVSHREAMERSLEKLDLLEMKERIHHRPNELSGGQQQRVAIARALATNPTILLADEPTGALDQKTGHQVMDLFHELHDEGRTIIMITHDRHIAQNASRLVRILDGVLSEGAEDDA